VRVVNWEAWAWWRPWKGVGSGRAGWGAQMSALRKRARMARARCVLVGDRALLGSGERGRNGAQTAGLKAVGRGTEDYFEIVIWGEKHVLESVVVMGDSERLGPGLQRCRGRRHMRAGVTSRRGCGRGAAVRELGDGVKTMARKILTRAGSIGIDTLPARR